MIRSDRLRQAHPVTGFCSPAEYLEFIPDPIERNLRPPQAGERPNGRRRLCGEAKRTACGAAARQSDDKRRARLGAMRHFLSTLAYPGRDQVVVHAPDPLIVGGAAQVIGRSTHILGAALHPEQRRTQG
ncbi:MAG TPA: hypothetical protein VGN83_28640 [Falsiroseomonas sp.]|jgi:hypothetical protein|nr:hypothetical protein [Falsiroseomonas sp.]